MLGVKGLNKIFGLLFSTQLNSTQLNTTQKGHILQINVFLSLDSLQIQYTPYI